MRQIEPSCKGFKQVLWWHRLHWLFQSYFQSASAGSSDGVLEWPIAFELLLIYLQEVDRQPDRWSLGTIYAGSGAIDVRRKEAAAIAKARYSPSFFRSNGGSPGITTGAGGKKLENIDLFNATSKRGCTAWNNGTAHDASTVDANGRCKFRHACNQWVTDKGKGGQCLGDHKTERVRLR